MIRRCRSHALHFRRGQNFSGQALGAFAVEQVFQVHAQTAPMLLVGDNRRRAAGAVGDRAADVRRPDWRAIFANWRNHAAALKLLQRRAGADAPRQKLRLPLGHRTLNTRRRLDGAALEVIAKQL